MIERPLRSALEQGLLRPIDYQFGQFITSLAADSAKEKTSEWSLWTRYTAILLSQAQANNHVCIDLKRYANQRVALWSGGPALHWPPLEEWKSLLLEHPAVAPAGEGNAPILLAQDRLYLARYWYYETCVAEQIKQRVQQQTNRFTTVQQREILPQLEALFPEADDGINWQKVACVQALLQQFLVITGGPGTGKTTTVIRLLALQLMQQEHPQNTVIRLVAPTGKAAVRMTESIRSAKQGLMAPDHIKHFIPEHASTIHRLLGALPHSVHFRHHKDNPLHVDLLVVDEASMVDLPLMAKLLDALPAHCKLVLLGDKDQLSSVEAGSVLGDLCQGIVRQETGYTMSYHADLVAQLSLALKTDLSSHQSNHTEPSLTDCLCMLQKSYRFGGGISQLAQSIHMGDWLQVQRILLDARLNDVVCLPAEMRSVIQFALLEYEAFFHDLSQDPAAIIKSFDRFRVLCASHHGQFGTQAVNVAIEQGLIQKGLAGHGEFYVGLPVMILRNDYDLKLFNGDIGIVLPKETNSDELRVFFMQPDGTVRAVLPARLPPHDKAFAMTIHKSQGSEFSHVAMVLPDEPGYQQLLTRELLYTGITRAKQTITLFASEPALKLSVQQMTIRESGLAARFHTT